MSLPRYCAPSLLPRKIRDFTPPPRWLIEAEKKGTIFLVLSQTIASTPSRPLRAAFESLSSRSFSSKEWLIPFRAGVLVPVRPHHPRTRQTPPNSVSFYGAPLPPKLASPMKPKIAASGYGGGFWCFFVGGNNPLPAISIY